MDKVYCENCRWLYSSDWGSSCDYVVGQVDTPMQKKNIYAVMEEDNRDNNCRYYEKRVTLRDFIPGRLG